MTERATVTLEVPLAELDPEVAEALDLERKRQQNTLEMIASCRAPYSRGRGRC